VVDGVSGWYLRRPAPGAAGARPRGCPDWRCGPGRRRPGARARLGFRGPGRAVARGRPAGRRGGAAGGDCLARPARRPAPR